MARRPFPSEAFALRVKNYRKRRGSREQLPSEVFAQNMKRTRERLGWSQERLARELSAVGWKVGRVAMTKIETGVRGVSLDDAIAIAKVFSVSPAALYRRI